MHVNVFTSLDTVARRLVILNMINTTKHNVLIWLYRPWDHFFLSVREIKKVCCSSVHKHCSSSSHPLQALKQLLEACMLHTSCTLYKIHLFIHNAGLAPCHVNGIKLFSLAFTDAVLLACLLYMTLYLVSSQEGSVKSSAVTYEA